MKPPKVDHENVDVLLQSQGQQEFRTATLEEEHAELPTMTTLRLHTGVRPPCVKVRHDELDLAQGVHYATSHHGDSFPSFPSEPPRSVSTQFKEQLNTLTKLPLWYCLLVFLRPNELSPTMRMSSAGSVSTHTSLAGNASAGIPYYSATILLRAATEMIPQHTPGFSANFSYSVITPASPE